MVSVGEIGRVYVILREFPRVLGFFSIRPRIRVSRSGLYRDLETVRRMAVRILGYVRDFLGDFGVLLGFGKGDDGRFEWLRGKGGG